MKTSTESNITKNCKCGKNIHRPGSRYCSQCGNFLDLKNDNPENCETKIIGKFEFKFSSHDQIKGIELASTPFFVTPSGYYFHYAYNPENFNINTLPLLHDKKNKGFFLGLKTNDEICPWVLVTWTNLVLLYNGFEKKSYVVWEAKNDSNECLRLPCVAEIGEKGTIGSYLRIFLVIKENNILTIKSYNLRLSSDGQYNRWNWSIEQIDTWPQFKYDNTMIITEPVYNKILKLLKKYPICISNIDGLVRNKTKKEIFTCMTI